MANSNLDVAINRRLPRDFAPIKQALNLIVDSFNELQSEMNMRREVARFTQVSDGSQALSQGTTEQASSIEQLNASITEIGPRRNRMRSLPTRPTIWPQARAMPSRQWPEEAYGAAKSGDQRIFDQYLQDHQVIVRSPQTKSWPSCRGWKRRGRASMERSCRGRRRGQEPGGRSANCSQGNDSPDRGIDPKVSAGPGSPMTRPRLWTSS
jgi:hypothetical protein